MEKNNIKYLIFSIGLLGISWNLNYNTFYINTTYLYPHFDFTGVTQTIQRVMTIILLIIAIICLIKAIRAREKGVDFLFNKCMVAVFIIYTILSIATYIYVRGNEEKVAMKMKNEIESYNEINKQELLKKNKIKKKNSYGYDFYSSLSEGIAESEYAINDKYYERKKEIIEQVENSSKIERYVSMLFYNYSYEHYEVEIKEIEYYGIFLQLFLIGVLGTGFYLFNVKVKEQNNVFYE